MNKAKNGTKKQKQKQTRKVHIIDKLKESRATISKGAESTKNNVDNRGKIWEVKQKFKKKEQNLHQI